MTCLGRKFDRTNFSFQDGSLQPDNERFPSGIRALADYVHSLGLKFGIYEDYGTQTCEGYPGVLGHLAQDAQSKSKDELGRRTIVFFFGSIRLVVGGLLETRRMQCRRQGLRHGLSSDGSSVERHGLPDCLLVLVASLSGVLVVETELQRHCPDVQSLAKLG